MIFLASEISTHNETLGDTGWTVEQFIEWANEVKVVVDQKFWEVREGWYEFQHVPGPLGSPGGGRLKKVWKVGGRKLMDPNDPWDHFLVAILLDPKEHNLPLPEFSLENQVKRISPTYQCELDFNLPAPYQDLPAPVRKVLDSVNQEYVGKEIGEIFPQAKDLIDICPVVEGEHLKENSEIISFKLLELSEDKLNFTVRSEDFIFSEDEEIRGRIGDRVVLYAPEGSKVGFCKKQISSLNNKRRNNDGSEK